MDISETELQFLKFLAWAVLLIILLVMRRLIQSMVTNLIYQITGRRCVTKIKVHKINYIWEIHDFSFHKIKITKGGRLESPMFTSATEKGGKWSLILYPNGVAISQEHDSSLFLVLDRSSKYTNVIGEFKFSFLSKSHTKTVVDVKRTKQVVIGGNNAWGIFNFIPHRNILPDNTLMIFLEGTFSTESDVTNISDQPYSINKSNVPEKHLSSDLGRLFDNKEFTDMVLSVKGKNYPVHKSILAARSPVFAAMFSHEDLEENQKNKVDIEDFEAEVIEAMLEYIYTGYPIELKILAEGLLKAANKYELDGLKEMSEEVLITNLSFENVIDLLIFSDLYCARKLKKSVINFIAERSTHVMATNAWKEIATSHPQLLLEVCEVLASKKKTLGAIFV